MLLIFLQKPSRKQILTFPNNGPMVNTLPLFLEQKAGSLFLVSWMDLLRACCTILLVDVHAALICVFALTPSAQNNKTG